MATARVLLLVMCLGAFVGCNFQSRRIDLIEPLLIELTACEHRWQIVYDQRSLPSARPIIQPRGHIHIPEQTDVCLTLKSQDYVYTVALPQLGQKELAVPDLVFQLHLGPVAKGTYEFTGEQLCNEPNLEPPIYLIVEDRQAFEAWIENLQRT